MALPDLIDSAYANAALAAYPFSVGQLAFAPYAITAASNEIRRWCMDRDFNQLTYTGIILPVTLNGYIRLPQVPINQILRVQATLTDAISISNGSATSSQVLFSYVGDAASGQTVTGLSLQWTVGGRLNTVNVPYVAPGSGTVAVVNGQSTVDFATSQSGLLGKYISIVGDLSGGQYLVIGDTDPIWTIDQPYAGASNSVAVWGVDLMTINDLADAINAVGSGWSAQADGVLGAWPVTELYDGFLATGTDQQTIGVQSLKVFADDVNATFHPDDGQLTGLVWTGQQYSGLGPRWGPYPPDWDWASDAPNVVKVAYNAGFSTIPPIVQLACAEGVRVILQRMRYNPYLESFSAGEVAYTVAKTMMQSLPPYILQELSAYRLTNA